MVTHDQKILAFFFNHLKSVKCILYNHSTLKEEQFNEVIKAKNYHGIHANDKYM